MKTISLTSVLIISSLVPTCGIADDRQQTKESTEVRRFIDGLKKLSDEDLLRKGRALASKLKVDLNESVKLQRLDSRIDAESSTLSRLQQQLTQSQSTLKEQLVVLRDQRDSLRKSVKDRDEADRQFKLLAATRLDYLADLRTRIATIQEQISQLGSRVTKDKLKRKLLQQKIDLQSDPKFSNRDIRRPIVPASMLVRDAAVILKTSEDQDQQFDLLMKSLDQLETEALPNKE